MYYDYDEARQVNREEKAERDAEIKYAETHGYVDQTIYVNYSVAEGVDEEELADNGACVFADEKQFTTNLIDILNRVGKFDIEKLECWDFSEKYFNFHYRIFVRVDYDNSENTIIQEIYGIPVKGEDYKDKEDISEAILELLHKYGLTGITKITDIYAEPIQMENNDSFHCLADI